MIDSEDVQKAIDRFEDETGASVYFGITCSRFGTPGSARHALEVFIAQQINDKLEIHD